MSSSLLYNAAPMSLYVHVTTTQSWVCFAFKIREICLDRNLCTLGLLLQSHKQSKEVVILICILCRNMRPTQSTSRVEGYIKRLKHPTGRLPVQPLLFNNQRKTPPPPLKTHLPHSTPSRPQAPYSADPSPAPQPPSSTPQQWASTAQSQP